MSFAPTGVDHFEKIFWIKPHDYRIQEHQTVSQDTEARFDPHWKTIEQVSNRVSAIIH